MADDDYLADDHYLSDDDHLSLCNSRLDAVERNLDDRVSVDLTLEDMYCAMMVCNHELFTQLKTKLQVLVRVLTERRQSAGDLFWCLHILKTIANVDKDFIVDAAEYLLAVLETHPSDFMLQQYCCAILGLAARDNEAGQSKIIALGGARLIATSKRLHPNPLPYSEGRPDFIDAGSLLVMLANNHAETIVKAGGVEALGGITAIVAGVQTREELGYLTILFQIASNKENQVALFEQDVIQDLLVYLQKLPDNVRVQELCLNTLGVLLQDSRSSVMLLGRSKGFEIILAIIEKHSEHETVKTAALNVLFHVTQASVEQLLQGEK
jgi:hypothetical protein